MIKEKNLNKFSFQFVFIMLLFLMIVILSVMIILLGKDVYLDINCNRNSNYTKRVSLSYVSNKIRQNDENGNIRIEDVNGSNAIVITETYDTENYETWIYYYDNSIYEMFTDAGMKFNPDDGMRIMDIENFEIEKLSSDLYKFTTSESNKTSELIINLYSE